MPARESATRGAGLSRLHGDRLLHPGTGQSRPARRKGCDRSARASRWSATPTCLALIGARITRNLEQSGLAASSFAFSGETTRPAMDALAEQARGTAPDVVVGAGGGRALDAAKGVARRLGRPFISVPTIASTDAPASRGLVVYDDEHRLVGVEQLARNPDYVIVDTAVIAAGAGAFPARRHRRRHRQEIRGRGVLGRRRPDQAPDPAVAHRRS